MAAVIAATCWAFILTVPVFAAVKAFMELGIKPETGLGFELSSRRLI
jgi:hypothetical protein